MFFMKQHSGDAGYRITIQYNRRTDLYVVTGYILDMKGTGISAKQDGAALSFNSMEDAMNHLAGYKVQ